MPGEIVRKYKIRNYTDRDHAALLELWQKAGLSCRPQGRDSKENLKLEMKKGSGRFFIADTATELVGVVLATHDGRKGWINRLAVDPAWRNQKIAQILVAKAEAWITEKSIGIITCLIEDYNRSSMEFFEKLDYVKHKEIIYFSKRLYDTV